ncbi:MAG: hypothetical protein KH149_07915 [Clostridiales bacterium]|nr:hypothetical protein [Clostridiales bacterium]
MQPKAPDRVYILTHPLLRVDSTVSEHTAHDLQEQGWHLIGLRSAAYSDGYIAGYMDALCAVLSLMQQDGAAEVLSLLDTPVLRAWPASKQHKKEQP